MDIVQIAVVVIGSVLGGLPQMGASAYDLSGQRTDRAGTVVESVSELISSRGSDMDTFLGNTSHFPTSILTHTEFDFVVLKETDWNPALGRLELRREDLVIQETDQVLRVQGTETVFFGTSEEAESTPIGQGIDDGRATPQGQAKQLASLVASQPESPSWPERVTDTAQTFVSKEKSQAIIGFWNQHRLALTAVGCLVVLLCLGRLYRYAIRPW